MQPFTSLLGRLPPMKCSFRPPHILGGVRSLAALIRAAARSSNPSRDMLARLAGFGHPAASGGLLASQFSVAQRAPPPFGRRKLASNPLQKPPIRNRKVARLAGFGHPAASGGLLASQFSVAQRAPPPFGRRKLASNPLQKPPIRNRKVARLAGFEPATPSSVD